MIHKTAEKEQKASTNDRRKCEREYLVTTEMIRKCLVLMHHSPSPIWQSCDWMAPAANCTIHPELQAAQFANLHSIYISMAILFACRSRNLCTCSTTCVL